MGRLRPALLPGMISAPTTTRRRKKEKKSSVAQTNDKKVERLCAGEAVTPWAGRAGRRLWALGGNDHALGSGDHSTWLLRVRPHNVIKTQGGARGPEVPERSSNVSFIAVSRTWERWNGSRDFLSSLIN